MSTFNSVGNLHLHWHAKIKYKLPIPPNAFHHSFLEVLLSTSFSHILSFPMTLFSLYFSSLFSFFFHDKTNSPSQYSCRFVGLFVCCKYPSIFSFSIWSPYTYNFSYFFYFSFPIIFTFFLILFFVPSCSLI